VALKTKKAMKFINLTSKPVINNPLAGQRGTSPNRKGEKHMCQIIGKSSVVCKILMGAMVAAAMAFSSHRAEADQIPAGCTGNNLTYNLVNVNGLVDVTNGTVVTYVITITQLSDPSSCNILLSSNGLTFICPDANGVADGTTTTLIPPGTILPGGSQSPPFTLTFTNQCTISVNPGVHTAQVKLTDGGAVLQDNTLQNDPAAISKTLSVNISNN
jgi:hypothetical protein